MTANAGKRRHSQCPVARALRCSPGLSAGWRLRGGRFQKPAAPDVGEYTRQPLPVTVASPDVEGGQAQRFTKGHFR